MSSQHMVAFGRGAPFEITLSPRFNRGDLLWRENELSPFRAKDHDAGCFHAVIDEDIHFAVNFDPGFVNGFEGNRPKWFLPNFFQDTLDRHSEIPKQEQDAGSKQRILNPAVKHEYGTVPRISESSGKRNANCFTRMGFLEEPSQQEDDAKTKAMQGNRGAKRKS